MVNWDGIHMKEDTLVYTTSLRFESKATVVMIRPMEMFGCCWAIKVVEEKNHKVISGNCQLKT